MDLQQPLQWKQVAGKELADQLIDFIRAKTEKSELPKIDWQAKKDRWVLAVDALYQQVSDMLLDSTSAEGVNVRRFPVEVSEEFVGPYSIKALEVILGRERVEFWPKGLTVVGASGRVDVRGDRDVVTLLWQDNESDGGWQVVTERVPKLKKIPFNRDALKIVLERVMLP